MVSLIYRYKDEGRACAHCGAVQDLFVLEIHADADPALRPAGPKEVGICLESWRLVRVAIAYTIARRPMVA
jgi:hypothetical protein